MSTYTKGQAVTLKPTPGFDVGPYEIIEVIDEYEAFMELPDHRGYRLKPLSGVDNGQSLVAHDDAIEGIFNPLPGDIIQLPSHRPYLDELRQAFDRVIAARESLVKAVNEFKMLLDKTEDSNGA